MAAKSTPKKKPAIKKKSTAKKKAAPKKKATGKKAASKKPTASSGQVAMGHVFSLRPRVVTAFKPDDFRRAKQLLEEEAYADIQAAARAVVEKALELTQGGPDGIAKPRRH